MITKSNFAVAALAAGMFVTFANPAAAEGGYVSAMGGYSRLHDSTLSGERDDLGVNIDSVKLDSSSFVGGAAVGYTFKDPWRLELEGSYQKYDVEQILNTAKVLVAASGDASVITGTVNGIYEFRQSDSSLTPYIGAGVGAVYVKANDITRAGRSTSSGSAVAPTGVAMLGVGYDVSENVTVTAGYRLQAIGVLSGDTTRSNGSTVDGEADAILLHSVIAGLRFNF